MPSGIRKNLVGALNIRTYESVNSSIKNNYLPVFLLLLCIITRLLFIPSPFWGLEYEDSFIYNDAGRQFAFPFDYSSVPFKTQSCLDGSFQECYSFGSYGGHLLTYPFFLHVFNNLIGYSSGNVFYFNFFISSLLIVILFLWSSHLKKQGQNFININILLGLFIITPFISIFHTSGLAETTSSLFVTLFFISLYTANENQIKIRSLSFWMTFLFLSLSILTKRENLTLILFLFTIPFFRCFFNQEPVKRSYLLLVTCAVLFGLAFSFYIKVWGIEGNEAGDIGQGTFSLNLFLLNLEQLFKALTNVSYWGLTGIGVILSLIYCIISRRISRLGLLSLSLALLYGVIYSSHYRSYYQVVHGLSYPFETLRYSVNYFPLIAIFLSTVRLPKIFDCSKKQNLQGYFPKYVVIILFLFLTINLFKVRKSFSEDEYFSRIEPVNKTLQIIQDHDIVITDIPIVFRAYIKECQHIIDTYTLEENRFQEILETRPSGHIYLLLPKTHGEEDDRFSINFDYSRFQETNVNITHYSLFRYQN